jgi:catechol 2,3-dioxygenase-like lactoylglutathione lyase family enzyme
MARMKIRSVNHVGIPIADRARAMKMFRDVMGLNVIPHQVDGNTLAWTEAADGTMVHLIDPPAPGRPDGRQHVAFEVDDLDVVIEALKEAGVPLTGGPGVRHDGQRFLFISDPDGNRIEIATRGDHAHTKRKVDENGYTTVP